MRQVIPAVYSNFLEHSVLHKMFTQLTNTNLLETKRCKDGLNALLEINRCRYKQIRDRVDMTAEIQQINKENGASIAYYKQRTDSIRVRVESRIRRELEEQWAGNTLHDNVATWEMIAAQDVARVAAEAASEAATVTNDAVIDIDRLRYPSGSYMRINIHDYASDISRVARTVVGIYARAAQAARTAATCAARAACAARETATHVAQITPIARTAQMTQTVHFAAAGAELAAANAARAARNVTVAKNKAAGIVNYAAYMRFAAHVADEADAYSAAQAAAPAA
jgi:hypothetical protein